MIVNFLSHPYLFIFAFLCQIYYNFFEFFILCISYVNQKVSYSLFLTT